jgi:hypothetical protein
MPNDSPLNLPSIARRTSATAIAAIARPDSGAMVVWMEA